MHDAKGVLKMANSFDDMVAEDASPITSARMKYLSAKKRREAIEEDKEYERRYKEEAKRIKAYEKEAKYPKTAKAKEIIMKSSKGIKKYLQSFNDSAPLKSKKTSTKKTSRRKFGFSNLGSF